MAKKEPELTAEQQQQLEAVGIDLQAVDWAKALGLLKLVISLFANQPPVMKGVHPEDEDHGECCLATMEAQMKALQCCMDHYEKCCSGS